MPILGFGSGLVEGQNAATNRRQVQLQAARDERLHTARDDLKAGIEDVQRLEGDIVNINKRANLISQEANFELVKGSVNGMFDGDTDPLNDSFSNPALRDFWQNDLGVKEVLGGAGLSGVEPYNPNNRDHKQAFDKYFQEEYPDSDVDSFDAEQNIGSGLFAYRNTDGKYVVNDGTLLARATGMAASSAKASRILSERDTMVMNYRKKLQEQAKQKTSPELEAARKNVNRLETNLLIEEGKYGENKPKTAQGAAQALTALTTLFDDPQEIKKGLINAGYGEFVDDSMIQTAINTRAAEAQGKSNSATQSGITTAESLVQLSTDQADFTRRLGEAGLNLDEAAQTEMWKVEMSEREKRENESVRSDVSTIDALVKQAPNVLEFAEQARSINPKITNDEIQTMWSAEEQRRTQASGAAAQSNLNTARSMASTALNLEDLKAKLKSAGIPAMNDTALNTIFAEVQQAKQVKRLAAEKARTDAKNRQRELEMAEALGQPDNLTSAKQHLQDGWMVSPDGKPLPPSNRFVKIYNASQEQGTQVPDVQLNAEKAAWDKEFGTKPDARQDAKLEAIAQVIYGGSDLAPQLTGGESKFWNTLFINPTTRLFDFEASEAAREKKGNILSSIMAGTLIPGDRSSATMLKYLDERLEIDGKLTSGVQKAEAFIHTFKLLRSSVTTMAKNDGNPYRYDDTFGPLLDRIENGIQLFEEAKDLLVHDGESVNADDGKNPSLRDPSAMRPAPKK